MMPAMPTGDPSASQIRQSSPVSPESGTGPPEGPDHAVEGGQRLARLGPPDHQTVAGQSVEVVGVGGLAQFQHHIVGRIDHIVDRSHPGQRQPSGQPLEERARPRPR